MFEGRQGARPRSARGSAAGGRAVGRSGSAAARVGAGASCGDRARNRAKLDNGNRAKLDTRHKNDHGHPLQDGRGAFGWLLVQARARALDFFWDRVESMTLGAGVGGGGAPILRMARSRARRTA